MLINRFYSLLKKKYMKNSILIKKVNVIDVI